jgi:hypothetical protein
LRCKQADIIAAISSLIAGVVGSGDKHKDADISVNFLKI